jgi:hypothetical protein
MKNGAIRICSLLIIGFLFINWGYQGHYKISSSITCFFPKEMSQFKIWSQLLSQHSADADERKKTDRSEGRKHFIDVDNYSDFVKNHKIIENYDSAVIVYGNEFINKNGTLPWVTDSTYHSLVHYMKVKEWKQAILTASDLGHYVGDGFMPLHITNNYNGGLTNQKGIHARYESDMIEKYLNEIKYDSSEISPVKDVRSYIFNYLYHNYMYKDSVLMADKAAFEQANNSYSDSYYQYLWKYTKDYTIQLFKNASKTTAELIYTAWIEAGKPKFNSSDNPSLIANKSN